MSPSMIFSLFFLLLLLLLPAALAGGDIVADTCRKSTAGESEASYRSCVQVLNSDPASSRARDVKDLAKIAVGIAAGSCREVLADINRLMSQPGGGRGLKECLRVCKELYESAVYDLVAAPGNIDSGDFGTVRAEISNACGTAGDCEDCFSEVGDPSPLTSDNKKFSSIGNIATAIFDLLHK
ncbi:Putative invertase inhibitor [Apostasia shenzhenica]|uniref:Invertase inhibitor n=1 Tax=Apostasia shenzhenica TaxID=1088818 RepID=A0A2I0BEP6_9ASPA|nr:Putative invertase inhibitor [Apostasia shenzhenica]